MGVVVRLGGRRLVSRSVRRLPVRCESAATPATAAETEYAATFTRATVVLAGSAPEAGLSGAVAAGDVPAVMGAFDWDSWRERVGKHHEKVVRSEYETAFAVSADGLVAVPADLTLLARAYAAESAAALAKQVLDVDAVRSVIVDALGRGWSVDQTARVIRSSVGMTPRMTRAAESYAEGLLNQGMDRARFDRMMASYHRTAISRRARLIARTELVTASNTGAYSAWQRAMATGVLTDGALKEWVTAADDRTCELCGPMNGERVPVLGQFSHGGDMPPRHPACRCTAVVV